MAVWRPLIGLVLLLASMLPWGAGPLPAAQDAAANLATGVVRLRADSTQSAAPAAWIVASDRASSQAPHSGAPRVSAYTATTRDDYYARSTLTPDERAGYDVIYDGLLAMQDQIDVSGLGLSLEDAERLLHYISNDAPELFWWTGNASGAYRGDTMVDIRPEYGYTPAEARALQARIDAAAAEILATLSPGMSEYARMWQIATALSARLVYDQAAADSGAGPIDPDNYDHQTIVGGLVNGQALCAGITRSYQYLLYRAGIVSFCVTGTADSWLDAVPPGPHAWNLLRIDGAWYYADLTNAMALVATGNSRGFLKDEQAILVHCSFVNIKDPADPSDDANENPPLPATGTALVAADAGGVASGTRALKRVYECLARSTELAP